MAEQKKRLTAATVNLKRISVQIFFLNKINYLRIIKQEKVHICRKRMIKATILRTSIFHVF
jgi:hypothetical protein